MIEQIVVLLPRELNVNWKELDDRIHSAQRISVSHGVHIVNVPTFKPLTEVLLKIAKKLPEARVLEISNLQVIQAKVILPRSCDSEQAEEVLLAKLKAINGCTVMFSFRYPVDGTPAARPPLSVSLRVSTLALIQTIQVCWSLDIEVRQIYDFWE